MIAVEELFFMGCPWRRFMKICNVLVGYPDWDFIWSHTMV